MRKFFKFWWLCAKRAFPGNAAFANDWQWVFGSPIVSSLAGIFLATIGGLSPTLAMRLGITSATTGSQSLDAFIGALAAFIITWLVAFTIRFANAPVVLFYEQRDQVKVISRSITDGKEIARPSFEVGFELSGKAESGDNSCSTARYLFETQELCRIWVQNSESRPILGCRLTVESIVPKTDVKNGALLLPDNRGSEEQESAVFSLAATERRYFKFIRLTRPLLDDGLKLSIKSDQDGTGFAGVFSACYIEFGQSYRVRLAVHGDDAVSGRLELRVFSNNERDLRVEQVSDLESKGQSHEIV